MLGHLERTSRGLQAERDGPVGYLAYLFRYILSAKGRPSLSSQPSPPQPSSSLLSVPPLSFVASSFTPSGPSLAHRRLPMNTTPTFSHLKTAPHDLSSPALHLPNPRHARHDVPPRERPLPRPAGGYLTHAAPPRPSLDHPAQLQLDSRMSTANVFPTQSEEEHDRRLRIPDSVGRSCFPSPSSVCPPHQANLSQHRPSVPAFTYCIHNVHGQTQPAFPRRAPGLPAAAGEAAGQTARDPAEEGQRKGVEGAGGRVY